MAELEDVDTETTDLAPTTLREDLEAAMEQHSQPAEEADEAPTTPQEGSRGRDEHGRFLPREQEAEAPRDRVKRQAAPAELERPTARRQGQAPAPVVPVPSAVERAPAFLRPEVGELWKKLGPEYAALKEDFHRRDTETLAVLERTKGDRQVIEQLRSAIAPYQAMVMAEGGNVVTGLQSYYQAAQLMRTGSPPAKANWVAQLCRTFNVDLQMLDQALAGQPNPTPAGTVAPQPMHDPRLDQLLADNQRQRSEQLENAYQSERHSLSQWSSAGNNEFWQYVKDDMADLIESAAKRNREMSYDDAYSAAIHANPEIMKVIRQREAAAAQQATHTQRSRRASLSLRPNAPVAPPGPSGGSSLRQDLLESYEAVVGR